MPQCRNEQLHHLHDGHALLLDESVHLNPDDYHLMVNNLFHWIWLNKLGYTHYTCASC
jgi:hypothetical protein